MRISQRGIDLIKRYEGVCLQAYRDAVGVVTIGYGHTTARSQVSRRRC
jgi:lysozyme